MSSSLHHPIITTPSSHHSVLEDVPPIERWTHLAQHPRIRAQRLGIIMPEIEEPDSSESSRVAILRSVAKRRQRAAVVKALMTKPAECRVALLDGPTNAFFSVAVWDVGEGRLSLPML